MAGELTSQNTLNDKDKYRLWKFLEEQKGEIESSSMPLHDIAIRAATALSMPFTTHNIKTACKAVGIKLRTRPTNAAGYQALIRRVGELEAEVAKLRATPAELRAELDELKASQPRPPHSSDMTYGELLGELNRLRAEVSKLKHELASLDDNFIKRVGSIIKGLQYKNGQYSLKGYN